MQRRRIFLTALVALVLVGLTWGGTAAASYNGQAPEENEVEFTGVIQEIGTDSLVVDETTDIKDGPERLELADLEVGWTVRVAGFLLPDGTVAAKKVRVVDDEEPVTPEPEGDHPVGLALATFFEVMYHEIMTWHEDGIGFGNIAKAYFVAEAVGEDELTAEQILQDKLSGMGWGQLMKHLGLSPSSKDKNLGQVMSGHGDDDEPEEISTEEDDHPGKGHGPPDKDKTPPGHEKKGKDKKD